MRLHRTRLRMTVAGFFAVAIATPFCQSKASAGEKDTNRKELKLTGVTLSPPSSWTSRPPKHPGPMSPKAIYAIPAIEGDSQTGMVRITYFPGMKGKDDMNINRWLGQVTQPDGKASTRKHAKITKKTVGDVKLTIVDVSGAARVTMRDKPQPGSRMIAAIIDHPKGPHFVVIAGHSKLIKKWEKEIYKFLESAKVGE
jgi:hypothetical protein